jgi:hypothetical protein
MLATMFCPDTRSEVFVASTVPRSVCPLHAGSGDPSPYFEEQQPSEPGIAPMGETPRSEEQRRETEQRRRERDKGIKGLLRRIFGE